MSSMEDTWRTDWPSSVQGQWGWDSSVEYRRAGAAVQPLAEVSADETLDQHGFVKGDASRNSVDHYLVNMVVDCSSTRISKFFIDHLTQRLRLLLEGVDNDAKCCWNFNTEAYRIRFQQAVRDDFIDVMNEYKRIAMDDQRTFLHITAAILSTKWCVTISVGATRALVISREKARKFVPFFSTTDTAPVCLETFTGANSALVTEFTELTHEENVVVVATDGLWSYVPHRTAAQQNRWITEFVAKRFMSKETPGEIALALCNREFRDAQPEEAPLDDCTAFVNYYIKS